MSEIYYDDPIALAPLKMKSRVVGDAIVPSHDVEKLPGTVETDIGQSKGFLATLAGLAGTGGISLTTVVTGYLQTIATAISALAGAPSTAVLTTIPASASVVTLAASKASRLGLIVVNNSTSTSTLWLKFGSGASLSSWSVAIEPGGYWEMPARYYTGIVTGIWNNATGDAHVTETG